MEIKFSFKWSFFAEILMWLSHTSIVMGFLCLFILRIKWKVSGLDCTNVNTENLSFRFVDFFVDFCFC